MIVESSRGVIGVIAAIAAADVCGGEAVAEEDDERILVGHTVQHVRSHG